MNRVLNTSAERSYSCSGDTNTEPYFLSKTNVHTNEHRMTLHGVEGMECKSNIDANDSSPLHPGAKSGDGHHKLVTFKRVNAQIKIK